MKKFSKRETPTIEYLFMKFIYFPIKIYKCLE